MLLVLILSLLMLLLLSNYYPIDRFVTQKPDSHHFKDILSQQESYRLNLLTKKILLHLNSRKINYFFAFGSLLGAVRHGRRMPWDDDIDIIISNKDINKLLDRLTITRKTNDASYYKLMNNITIKKKKWGIPIKIYFKNSRYPFIDINTYFVKGEYIEVPKKQLLYGHIHSFKEKIRDIYPLKVAKFGYFRVNIPRKYKKILVNQYGKDVLNTAYITYNHKPYCHKTSRGCENNNASEKIVKKISIDKFPKRLKIIKIYN